MLKMNLVIVLVSIGYLISLSFFSRLKTVLFSRAGVGSASE